MHKTFLIILTVFLIACSEKKGDNISSLEWVKSYKLESGTESMVHLLDTINKWQQQQKLDSRKVSWYKKIIYKFYKPLTTKIYEAQFFLYEGKTDIAIDGLEEIHSQIDESSELFRRFHELLAIAYLRKGEQENCILNHNNNSCLLPIQKNGIYTAKDNTIKAIKNYIILLNKYPSDWRYRWLLNVAYQTLGEYPDSVPKQFLIYSELMIDQDSTNNFKNIAPMLKIDYQSSAGGAIIEDFNNDGLLDIFTSGMFESQLKYYINMGSNGFQDKTKEARIEGLTNGFNLFQLDYNNDGWMDLLVVRGAWQHSNGLYPNSLLKNNQDGTFTDVTLEAGLLSFNPVATAVCADFNNDGWTDIYIGNESSINSATNHPNELYINDGNGKFNESAAIAGINIICLTKGISAGDYNNDGLTDLFVSNRRGNNFLFKNTGNSKTGTPKFIDVSKEAGISKPLNSFTSWFWDYNNDGKLDLFVSSYDYGKGNSAGSTAKHYAGKIDSTGRPFVYKNNGDGTFTNQSRQLGLDFPLNTMGANFGDVNNDGWLDFYIGTGEPDYMGIHPNRLILNKAGRQFIDVTSELGVGHIQKGHGIAFGDIDNDGDQDILAEMGGTANGDEFQNALFQNPGNSNNWVTLKLEGATSTKDAIGTKIKVVVSKSDTTQTLYRIVSSGGSFGSNSLQQEIGLGNFTKIDSLIVDWTNSTNNQIFIDLEINRLYILKESSDTPEISLTEPFKFKNMTTHKMHH
jgi:hypothetical protein